MGIRIDRVFTKTGDKGETSLATGQRVPKDCQRLEALGTVDELNCAVGLAAAEARSLPAGDGGPAEFAALLAGVQQKLFDLGASLAIPPEKWKEGMPAVGAADIRALEEGMDRWKAGLAPLDSFVLPGGGRLGALLHLCRAVCRRAERETVRLARTEPVGESAIPFLNRLSDWFFVAARRAARIAGAPEVLWTPGRGAGPAGAPPAP